MFTKVAIIGAGVMGKSIALAISLAGIKVTLVTRRGKEGFDDFIKYFQRELKKGRIQSIEPNVYSFVDWTKRLEKGIRDTDIVIETVIEDENVKKKLFKELDKLCPRETILASNTSSFSITEISGVTTSPERIIGLHFFNPAHIMKLVEVCPGKETSKKTIEKALFFVEMLGKTPILVKDSPGFLVNRILFPMINQALYCLMEDLDDAKTIDKAMELGANLPAGPLKLADYIGLDTCLKILEELYKRTGDPKYVPCPLLANLVKKGYLGRKSGKGIYEYGKSRNRD